MSGVPVIRILLVDDNLDDVRRYGEWLAQAKQAKFVLTTRTFLAGALLAVDSADAAIINLSLPDSSGLSTYGQIRDKAAHLPVVILCTPETEKDAKEAVKAGAQEYLVQGQMDANALEQAILHARGKKPPVMDSERSYKQENKRLRALSERLEADNRRVNAELEVARSVQEGLYPRDIPQMEGLKTRATILQAHKVGGDYYDILPIGDHRMAYLVVDVSGHDVASAFIVGMAKISFTAHIPEEASLSEVMRKVNADMKRVLKTDHFLTAFLAVIDTHTGILRYAKAGHFDQCLYRASAKKVELLRTEGTVIGYLKDPVVEEKSCLLENGDKLVLFTDGLFENTDPAGRRMGQSRLYELIQAEGGFGVDEMEKRILAHHREFCKGSDPTDDTCLVIAEFRKSEVSSRIELLLGRETPTLPPAILHDKERAKQGISEIMAGLEENNFEEGLIRQYRKILVLLSSAFQLHPLAGIRTLTAYAQITSARLKIGLMIDDHGLDRLHFFTTGNAKNILLGFDRRYGKLELSEPGDRLVLEFEKTEIPGPPEDDVRFDQRADGAWLTVPANLSGLKTFESVRNDLISQGVVNADFESIRKALDDRSGKAVRIGEPFRHYDREKEELYSLEMTPLQATLRLIKAPGAPAGALRREDLDYILLKNEIVFGIQKESLDLIAEKCEIGSGCPVARGIPPVNRKNAIIKERLDVDPTRKALVRGDGTTDFKALDLMRTVEKGTVILEKVPPLSGTPGTSIFGRTLDPRPGEDTPLPVGKNTELEADGTRLVASCTGYLYRNEAGIHVRQLFSIRTNVDYGTGNIDYEGDVLITGNVLSGFKVEAGGDIYIQGEVEAAEIRSRKGDVEIRNGVLGGGRAVLFAGGNLRAEFIQDARLTCGGDLTVMKSLLHVSADVGGKAVVLDREKGTILGGSILCGRGVESARIGNEQHVVTRLQLRPGIDGTVRRTKRTQLLRRKEEVTGIFANIKGQLEVRSQLFRIRSRQSTVDDVEKTKGLLKRFFMVKKHLENLEQSLRQYSEKEGPNTAYGQILVWKKIFPQVCVLFGETEKKIDSEAGPVAFSFEDGRIRSRAVKDFGPRETEENGKS